MRTRGVLLIGYMIVTLGFFFFMRHANAATVIITLDNITVSQCNETWMESGVELSFVNTTAEDYSGGGSCSFGLAADRVWLYPARLNLDISNLVGNITQVEVDIEDFCRSGCTRAFLYSGVTQVDNASNINTGSQTLNLSGNGASIDRIAVSSGEGSVLEVRIFVENQPPACDGDFDNDGDVDGSDLVVFAKDFAKTTCNVDCKGDLDSDGDCDSSDLEIFESNFSRKGCREWEVLDFVTYSFKRIRGVVDPEDKTRTKTKFVGSHVEVSSEHWTYVLDSTGQQIFRPIAAYPHLRPSFSKDISSNLSRWLKQPVSQEKVDDAKHIALSTLGVNYLSGREIDIVPTRELIASKSADTQAVKYYEGRTLVLFNPANSDSIVESYYTSTKQTPEGQTLTSVKPVDLPLRGYETAISFAPEGHVMRIESTFMTEEIQKIVDVFAEGLTNGSIKGLDYYSDSLRFGSFFSPEEWRFEYNAYSWESEAFRYLNPSITSSCSTDPQQYNPKCNPYYEDYYLYYPACLDVTSFDFDYYRITPHYRNDFWYWWYYNGQTNGIRGNCLDFDAETQSCNSWKIDNINIILHKNLKSYNVDGKISSYISWKHCDGVWTQNHPYNNFLKYRMEDQFYKDLEQCHIATIFTHGGMAFCFGFYQFMKERDLWVSLHRYGDDGLGKGNLRHLFLATCSSMNWNHGLKHGEQKNLFSDWMTPHIADGIRTICGSDGGLTGSHFTGLRFFKYYHLNESISQAWFNLQLEECTCNIPVIVAYGNTEDEAAATLFDGRMTKERGGTGWIIAAELITPHLVTHQACCLPGGRCIDAASYDCVDPVYVKWQTEGDVVVGGTPMGSGTQCGIHCPEYYGYPLCFD